MREIQIIIAIVNNHSKKVNPEDKVMQFQPTCKMQINRNRSRATITAEQILLIQDQEE